MGVLMGNGLRHALVQSDFACQLERELTEARTRIKELADIGGQLAEHIEAESINEPGSGRRVRDWNETVKRCLEGIE